MSFTYNAGVTTPGFGGLAEFPSLRINQGTYRPVTIPPLNQTMPLRVASSSVPRGGAFVDPPLPDVWTFDLAGYFYLPDPNDTQAAIDYLRAHVNTYQGWMTLTLNALGWAATRQMTVQVAGQVSAEDMEVERKKVPRRGFTIPLIAADPRIYSTATTVTTVTSGGTALANAGTTPTPFTVKFNGPQTDPILNGPGAGNNIALTRTLAGGEWVQVTTVDATTGTMTAVDNTGADAFGDVTQDTADYINPGSSTWTATNSAGAGTTVVTSRDAWG